MVTMMTSPRRLMKAMGIRARGGSSRGIDRIPEIKEGGLSIKTDSMGGSGSSSSSSHGDTMSLVNTRSSNSSSSSQKPQPDENVTKQKQDIDCQQPRSEKINSSNNVEPLETHFWPDFDQSTALSWLCCAPTVPFLEDLPSMGESTLGDVEAMRDDAMMLQSARQEILNSHKNNRTLFVSVAPNYMETETTATSPKVGDKYSTPSYQHVKPPPKDEDEESYISPDVVELTSQDVEEIHAMTKRRQENQQTRSRIPKEDDLMLLPASSSLVSDFGNMPGYDRYFPAPPNAIRMLDDDCQSMGTMSAATLTTFGSPTSQTIASRNAITPRSGVDDDNDSLGTYETYQGSAVSSITAPTYYLRRLPRQPNNRTYRMYQAWKNRRSALGDELDPNGIEEDAPVPPSLTIAANDTYSVASSPTSTVGSSSIASKGRFRRKRQHQRRRSSSTVESATPCNSTAAGSGIYDMRTIAESRDLEDDDDATVYTFDDARSVAEDRRSFGRISPKRVASGICRMRSIQTAASGIRQMRSLENDDHTVHSSSPHTTHSDQISRGESFFLKGPVNGSFENISSPKNKKMPLPLSKELMDTYHTFRANPISTKILNKMDCTVPVYFTDNTMTKRHPGGRSSKSLGGGPESLSSIACPNDDDSSCSFFPMQPSEQNPADVCSEPSASTLMVRGRNYLEDGVKTPSDESIFALLGSDSIVRDSKTEPHSESLHCSQQTNSYYNRLRSVCREAGISTPFLLVINFVVPWGNLISYFYRPDGTNGGSLNHDRKTCPSEGAWQSFLEGDEESRNRKLKFVPKMNTGPWMVKKMVGSSPVIIGQKLPVSYFGESDYLEICLDVTRGSSLANSIANAVVGKSDLITVDLSFFIEGQDESKLPEQALAMVRLHHVNMKKTYTNTEWVEEIERRHPNTPNTQEIKSPDSVERFLKFN